VDDFITAAQQEAHQVARDLERLREQLKPLNEERHRLEERAQALQTVIDSYRMRRRDISSEILVPPQQHFLDVAFQILQGHGPLYYSSILDRLLEQGVRVPGRNPGANLIAHMSRDRRFQRVGRGTYAIAGP
jgi:hypothetical protein